jgi:hypothetical protein
LIRRRRKPESNNSQGIGVGNGAVRNGGEISIVPRQHKDEEDEWTSRRSERTLLRLLPAAIKEFSANYSRL